MLDDTRTSYKQTLASITVISEESRSHLLQFGGCGDAYFKLVFRGLLSGVLRMLDSGIVIVQATQTRFVRRKYLFKIT
jgi:hypothetical protein